MKNFLFRRHSDPSGYVPRSRFAPGNLSVSYLLGFPEDSPSIRVGRVIGDPSCLLAIVETPVSRLLPFALW